MRSLEGSFILIWVVWTVSGGGILLLAYGLAWLMEWLNP